MPAIQINQQYGVTLTKPEWRASKDTLIEEAIGITRGLGNDKQKQKQINEVAGFIQRQMNGGSLSLKDVKIIVAQLKDKVGLNSDEAAALLKYLIILAKHNNNNTSPTKRNWFFGRTNYTRSMSYFLNRKDPQGKKIDPTTIKALKFECEGEIEELIADKYKNSTHYEKAGACFDKAAQLHPDKDDRGNAWERSAKAYDKAVSLYVAQIPRGSEFTQAIKVKLESTIDIARSAYKKIKREEEGATMLSRIALGFHDKRHYTESVLYFRQAADLFTKVGNSATAGDNYSQAAKILEKFKNITPEQKSEIINLYDLAATEYRKAKLIIEAEDMEELKDVAMGRPRTVGQGEEWIKKAKEAESQNAFSNAANCYLNAVTEFIKSDRNANDIALAYEKAATTLVRIKNYEFGADNYSKAATYYQEGRNLAKAIKNYKLAANNYAERKAHEKKIEMIDEALKCYQQINNPSKKLKQLIHELNSLLSITTELNISKKVWFLVAHFDKYLEFGEEPAGIISKRFVDLLASGTINDKKAGNKKTIELKFSSVRAALGELREQLNKKSVAFIYKKCAETDGFKQVISGILEEKATYSDESVLRITGANL
jgi:tetratricopeptide (TPR) repeat protein